MRSKRPGDLELIAQPVLDRRGPMRRGDARGEARARGQRATWHASQPCVGHDDELGVVEHGVVHHVRKSGASEPGQALRGSGDLHAWGDSNAYLLRRDGKPTLVVEHRSHRSPEPVIVRLDGDPPRLVVEGVATSPAVVPLDEHIVTALAERPLTRTALRERMGVRNETLGVVIDRLVTAGRVLRIEDGLAVPVPVSGISGNGTSREQRA